MASREAKSSSPTQDGALFIFTSRDAAEQFKELDPYGPHVVASSTVREWTTVELAETLYRASQRV